MQVVGSNSVRGEGGKTVKTSISAKKKKTILCRAVIEHIGLKSFLSM